MILCLFQTSRIFSILSAILLLGNVTYSLSEENEILEVGPAEVLSTLCDLLKVCSICQIANELTCASPLYASMHKSCGFIIQFDYSNVPVRSSAWDEHTH